MILALDTSTRTGFAYGVPGGELRWGARSFASNEGGSGQCVSMYRSWLGEMCTRLRPTMIVFESPWAPHFGSKVPVNILTLRRLYALVETTSSVAFERRIRCYETTTAQATKFLTGRGRWGDKGDTYDQARAKKKAAVIRACVRLGWDVEGDDDAGDACCLWSLAEDIVAPAAADRRRREAADRERLIAGEGPLFRPQKRNTPPAVTGEALLVSTSDEKDSSNAAGRKHKHFDGTIQRIEG